MVKMAGHKAARGTMSGSMGGIQPVLKRQRVGGPARAKDFCIDKFNKNQLQTAKKEDEKNEQPWPLPGARQEVVVQQQLVPQKIAEEEKKIADEENQEGQWLRDLPAIVINLVRRPDRMNGCA